MFIHQGNELTLRTEATAHILGHAHIASTSQFAQQRRGLVEGGVHVVRTAQQQHRIAAFRHRPIDVGA